MQTDGGAHRATGGLGRGTADRSPASFRRGGAGRAGQALLILLVVLGGAGCDLADSGNPSSGATTGAAGASAPIRNPVESLDDTAWQQQGGRSPCAVAWDGAVTAYTAWQTGTGSYDTYTTANQGYQACVSGNGYAGDGPISGGGPPAGDPGRPDRNPQENADAYRLQQQGQAGPCAAAFLAYDTAYDEWRAGQVTALVYQDARRGYQACVDTNYP